MKKYLKVMLVLVVALSLFSTFAFAGVFDNAYNAPTKDSNVNDAIKDIGGTIVSVIKVVGGVVAVVMVLVLAIQWLIGTPAKKQELKGKMWNILIGVILLVAGVTILTVIEQFALDAEKQIDVSSIETVEVRA